MRELVEAVAGSEQPLSIAQLANLLNLDKSATSRRWQNARARGYLRNLEEKKGKPARIVLADPLPDDVEILPTIEVLIDRCTAARVAEGAKAPSRPKQGDAGYAMSLDRGFAAGHITEVELRQLLRVDAFIAGRA